MKDFKLKDIAEITLNGVSLGCGENGLALLTEIQGLSIPTIRSSSGNFAGRDGGYLSSQFFGTREIVIDGVAWGNTALKSEQNFAKLLKAIPIRQLLPMYIRVASGQTYLAHVSVIDFKYALDNDKLHKFQMTLLSPSPNLYIANPDDENDGWNIEPLEPISGGGYITPFVLPVEWQDSAQATIINNTTNQIALPQIIFKGSVTNPIVRNLTTGVQIGLTLTTSGADSLAVIDMSDRTVTLNGGSILPSKTGEWWGLAPGLNTVELLATGLEETSLVTIRYRLPFISVFEGV